MKLLKLHISPFISNFRSSQLILEKAKNNTCVVYNKTVNCLNLIVFFLYFTVNIQAQNIQLSPKNKAHTYEVGTLNSLRFTLVETTINTNFTMVWNGRFTSHILKGNVVNNELIFDVPHFLNEQAGETEIVILANKKPIYKNSFYLLAGEAVGVIDAYIGPKTVNVDTLQKVLIVNIPKDKFQNPINDEKVVTSQIKFPKSEIALNENATNNLVAYVMIQPENQSGKIVVGTLADQAHSKEQEVKVEAGAPKNIDLAIVEQYPYADERQQTIITTNVLRDKNEAIVADGTNIDFLFDFKGTENTFKSYTVNGVATVAIQNPKEAGILNVKAVVYPEIFSKNLALSYESAIKEIVVELDNNQILVGPVSSRFGQLYTNGTAVVFTLYPGGLQFFDNLENGKANFVLNDKILKEIKPQKCVISIAGIQKTISLIANE